MAFPADLPTLDPSVVKRVVLTLFALVTIVGVLLDRFDARKKPNRT